jgi:hypothetical protein
MTEHEWKDDWKKAPGNKGHYCGGLQPIEYFACAYPVSVLTNILKYALRHEKKNGKEDVQKALWYLDWLMRIEEKDHVLNLFAGDFIASQDLDSNQKEVVLCMEEFAMSEPTDGLTRYAAMGKTRKALEAMLETYSA